MDIASATLLTGIFTLLVAVLGAAFALRQIQRWDRSRREDLQRQEDDDIIEWARVTRRDATVPVLTRLEGIPADWRREWREQKQKGPTRPRA